MVRPKKHVILYVPGLGDHRLTAQRTALRLWRIHGVTHEIVAVKWLEDDPWHIKLARLLDRIDHHTGQGKTVSLVGMSAGGAAVMAAFGQRSEQINAVVLVCAKYLYPEKLGHSYTSKHPALKDAVINSEQVATQLTESQKSKFLNMHPLADEIVPVPQTKLKGIANYRMFALGHFGGIAYAITLGSFRIVRFVKQRARS